jgi:Lipocalin-like domain
MMAYTGRYRVEGEKFITKVDVSWNELWNGSEQERFYKLDGNRLDIVSDWVQHLLLPNTPIVRAILRWERES